MPAITSPYRLEIVHPPHSFMPSPQPDLTGLERVGFVGGNEAYASLDLKGEIEGLRKLGGLSMDAVYHGTNSAALADIARRRAILSSQKLIEAGYDIRTGEISQPQGGVHRKQKGLPDIYACRQAVSTHYGFTDADTYAVIFGIRTPNVRDMYGDGLALGPRVELDKVVSMTVPPEQLPNAWEWTRANCNPGTLAMSWQAALVLSS